MTLIIAHRGASVAEPENTVAAFRRAVEMGADGIELDVRRTADDQLVVHHDAHLADGRLIRATRSNDLPAGIAAFDDALDACDGVFVNVEIKNDPNEPDFDTSEWVMHRLAAHLSGRGLGARWLVSSFRWETVERCRVALPGVRTALLVFEIDDHVVKRLATHGHVAVHPWEAPLEADTVAAAHRAGLAVNTWTCNDPDRIRELMRWGVDGICTDVPDLALSIRRSLR